MIVAAVDHAEDARQPPPRPLTLAWQCRTWHTLPEPGGLLDQPAGLVAQMTACENAYSAWKSFRRATSIIKWRSDHPHEWDVVKEILKLRG